MKYLLIAKFSEVEPLGIMYLSSALKQNGHKVDLCLYRENPFFDSFPQIMSFKPDIIGFSVYTGNHLEIYETCKKIKKYFGIKTAIGGHHATAFRDDCKKYADYVFVGESLKSLSLLDDKKVYPLLDIAEMPHPDRGLLYRKSSFHKKNRIKNIMASYGCPYNCAYCYNSEYHKLYKSFKPRIRTVDDVLDEAENIESELIFFQDDCFGINLNWLEEFAGKWNKRPFHCQLRFELAIPKRLRMLKDAGCTGVTCAIECANRDVRHNLLGRKVENEEIIESAMRIKESGLKLRTEQMIGIPETTLEDELKLLEWNCKIKPDIAWASIYQPYRGTKLGEYCIEKGYYLGNNDDINHNFFDRSVLNYSPKRKEQIQKLQRIFSVCAHMPEGHKLAKKLINGESLMDNAKKHLYGVLYG